MVSKTHPYHGQRIALASMHAKEQALVAPFRRVLGAEVVVAPALDTDELGTFTGEVPRPDALVIVRAVEKPVHVHDFHATVLHLLGLDHTKLTHRHAGRDYRLTDVHGEVVKEVLA